MTRALQDWKFYVIIFSLGVAWATLNSGLSAHVSETATMLEVTKETCYAVHIHAKLNPVACYDPIYRGWDGGKHR